jgi:hypothetical protein
MVILTDHGQFRMIAPASAVAMRAPVAVSDDNGGLLKADWSSYRDWLMGA